MVTCILKFTLSLLFCVQQIFCSTLYDVSESVALLKKTNCGALLESLDHELLNNVYDLLPNINFFQFDGSFITADSNVMLVNVDNSNWNLFINHVASLRQAGSDILMVAIAYGDNVCNRIAIERVLCYYDAAWVANIVSWFERTTDHSVINQDHTMLLGRMVASLTTVCLGYNTLLSDADIFWYRDPFEHIMRDADLTVLTRPVTQQEMIENADILEESASPFFSDTPGTYITFSNSLMHLKASPAAQQFALYVALTATLGLDGNADPQCIFLQTAMTALLKAGNLQLHPYR